MREVLLSVRLTTPVLGSVRKAGDDGNVVFRLPRTPEGRVSLPARYWREAAASVDPRSASGVRWSHSVEGVVSVWKRRFPKRAGGSPGGYARHEAILKGSLVTVRCLLPDGLEPDVFLALMDTAGKFSGVSPFRPREYGAFRAVGVEDAAASPV